MKLGSEQDVKGRCSSISNPADTAALTPHLVTLFGSGHSLGYQTDPTILPRRAPLLCPLLFAHRVRDTAPFRFSCRPFQS